MSIHRVIPRDRGGSPPSQSGLQVDDPMRTRKGGSAFPKCPRMEWLPALMTMTDLRAASSVVGNFEPALSPPTRPHTCLMVALRASVLKDTTAATRYSHWTISCSTARRLLSRLGDSCKYRTAFCSRATCRNSLSISIDSRLSAVTFSGVSRMRREPSGVISA
jgi:hypothetical protein